MDGSRASRPPSVPLQAAYLPTGARRAAGTVGSVIWSSCLVLVWLSPSPPLSLSLSLHAVVSLLLSGLPWPVLRRRALPLHPRPVRGACALATCRWDNQFQDASSSCRARGAAVGYDRTGQKRPLTGGGELLTSGLADHSPLGSAGRRRLEGQCDQGMDVCGIA